ERLRVLPVARRNFHDDVILVQSVVDRRYRTLAEGIVERVVDCERRKAKSRSGIAVDNEIDRKTALLLIGIDIGKLSRLLQGRRNAHRPFQKLVGIVALKG